MDIFSTHLERNENPFGMSPKVVQYLKENIEKANRYPDPDCSVLKDSFSFYYKVNNEQLFFGNGADELIFLLILGLTREGDQIITTKNSFVTYRKSIVSLHRSMLEVPVKNYKTDISAICQHISSKTKLVFLANPSNPFGTCNSYEELMPLVSLCEENNIPLVIDAAYSHFVTQSNYRNPLEIFRVNKNVIVINTLSKDYGLAGIRLGVLVADKYYIKLLNKVKLPYNVNFLAQLAGVAAMSDHEYMQKTVSAIIYEREHLFRELSKLPISVVKSQTNFILIDLKNNSNKLCSELQADDVFVNSLSEYDLPNHIRVSIGRRNDNIKFLKFISNYLASIYAYEYA
jgi:histidinol-phosphate aminotransferase